MGRPVARGIPARRLSNQLVTRAGARRPADVVAWLGAVQAQEYEPARWALGLRMRDGATDAEVARAFDEGRILRTHVMRPTWHFVTPADIRWLLALTAPRIHRTLASYTRRQGIDTRTLVRATSIVERALADRCYLTRAELGDRLRRAGFAFTGGPLANLAMYAELEAVVCSGPRRGKQFTYALVAERAPKAAALSRDEALATLAGRYFRSHAPATVRDFVWWSGLTSADARRGLDINRARPEPIDGTTYWTIDGEPRGEMRDRRVSLLPIYDEYLIAYRDRAAVPHLPSGSVAGAEPVTFRHALLVDGQVAGTWRTRRDRERVAVEVTPVRPLTAGERGALAQAIGRYEAFVRGG